MQPAKGGMFDSLGDVAKHLQKIGAKLDAPSDPKMAEILNQFGVLNKPKSLYSVIKFTKISFKCTLFNETINMARRCNQLLSKKIHILLHSDHQPKHPLKKNEGKIQLPLKQRRPSRNENQQKAKEISQQKG